MYLNIEYNYNACLSLCYAVLSCLQLFVTPWTVAQQVPISMGFSKQEYWSGVPFPKALQSMFVINAIVIMIFSVYKLGLNM